ncbi:zinc finger protein 14-like [Ornithodoros turicata]|uniref:zinc finger protein 14-like n=1 Tax=Ornithodoros turicata TaxID=34597 RepID=UPI0031389CE4
MSISSPRSSCHQGTTMTENTDVPTTTSDVESGTTIATAEVQQDLAGGHRCLSCNSDFESNDQLMEHSVAHHEEITMTANVDISTTSSDVATETTDVAVEVPQDVAGGHRCLCYNSDFESNDQLMEHSVACLETSRTSPVVSSARATGNKSYNRILSSFGNSCVVCGVVFNSWPRLRRHMTSHDLVPHDTKWFSRCRSANGTIRCRICGKVQRSMIRLRLHYSAHVKDRIFSCPKCPGTYKTSRNLVMHFRNAHVPRYKCSQCNFATAYYNILRHHELKHAGIAAKERCEACFKFLAKHVLLRHYYQHTGERPYPCKQCDSGFVTTSGLKNHVREVHGREKRASHHTGPQSRLVQARKEAVGDDGLPGLNNRCVVCGETFALWNLLRTHMATHDPAPQDPRLLDNCRLADGTIQCLVCGKFLRCMALLRSHYSCHTNARVFTCPKCPSAQKTSQHFIDHFRRAHTALAQTYQCSQCDFTTMYVETLYRHESIHAGTNKERCEACFKFFSKESLLRHYYRHTGEKRYACSQCSSGFLITSDLKSHIRRVHGNEKGATHRTGLKRRRPLVRREDVGLPGLNNQCIVCGEKFPLWHLLREHMKTHDPVPHDPRLLDDCRLPDGTLQCLVCGKIQPNMAGLRMHYAVHTNVRIFKCPKCPLAVKTSSYFLKHFRTAHTTLARVYKCNQCDFKTVYSRRQLRMHKLKHSRISQSERCEVCFKFFSKRALVRHYHRHTDENPHVCQQCGSRFVWPSKLKHHVRQVHESSALASHNGKPERRAQSLPSTGLPGLHNRCVVCGKTFLLWNLLRIHMGIHDPVPQDLRWFDDCRLADGSIQCLLCGKAQRNMASLRRHYGCHTDAHPFSCPNCPHTFKSSTEFLTHFRRAHSPFARIYKCSQCNFKTIYSRAYNEHVEEHAGIPLRERCEVCFKVLFKKSLLHHYHQHTGEKPYACLQCSCRYICVSRLQGHVKRVHEREKRPSDHIGRNKRRRTQVGHSK